MRIAALPHKYGRYAISPGAFDRLQDAKLVIDDDIMFGRKTPRHVVEGVLLVDIDKNAAVYGLRKTRPLDLARLKNHVAIGENNRWANCRMCFKTGMTEGNSRSANG